MYIYYIHVQVLYVLIWVICVTGLVELQTTAKQKAINRHG